jgi:FtsZ-interacting cell division protein ZipA
VKTWIIVVIVVVVLAVLLLGLVARQRSRVAGERKRGQAREHLQEAQVRSAQADKEQALAEEQAARARRERAEVEERAAQAERDARNRVDVAQEHRAKADELHAKAEKLAPGLSSDRPPANPADGRSAAGDTRRVDGAYPDESEAGGATRR